MKMIKNFFRFKPLTGLSLCLGLAVLGQFLMVQQGRHWTIVLGGFCFALAAFIFALISEAGMPHPVKAGSVSLALEFTLFFLVILEAALFRLVRLDQIPAGLNVDAAEIGWWALRILHGQRFPLLKDLQTYFVTPSPNYEAALWLRFFPATRYSIFLFSALVSLATLPLIYWFFRQLAGVPTALLTLAVIASMRWDIVLTRQAHLSLDVHFWMFGCLAFGYWALTHRKQWAWFVSAFFLTAGFYAYDAYKPFLLLVFLILAFEHYSGNPAIQNSLSTLKICLLLFLVFSSPMWFSLFCCGGFGNPIDHLSIWERIGKTRNWFSLIENPIRTALMFNHYGDEYPPYNLPGHRLLDDFTGILLVLGLGAGFWRARERKYFYGLAGAALMCLPATLTINPNSASRSVGALPFIAFFAAMVMVDIGRILSLSPRASIRASRWVFLAVALAWGAYQNGEIYFGEMPRSPDFNWRSGIQQTVIGQAIAEDGGRDDYYLASHFNDDYTIRYLDDAKSDRLRLLPWPAGTWPPAPATGRDAWFFLDLGQGGLLGLFQELYPHGTLQVFQDTGNGVGVYFYKVPAQDLAPGLALAGKIRKSGKGLWGEYRTANRVYSQVDPVLDFAYRSDFPVSDFPPLTVDWKGRLKIEKAGKYQFVLLGMDQGSLELDGRVVLKDINLESRTLLLEEKNYPIKVHFEKIKDFPATFHFFWKKPGSNRYEVVPNSVLETPEGG